eukprot:g9854.t1
MSRECCLPLLLAWSAKSGICISQPVLLDDGDCRRSTAAGGSPGASAAVCWKLLCNATKRAGTRTASPVFVHSNLFQFLGLLDWRLPCAIS